MRKYERRELLKRVFSFVLAFVMVLGYLPATTVSAAGETVSEKTSDPATFERLEPHDSGYLYKNDTLHAGKVTVDKSVTTTGMEHNGINIPLTDSDNFLVTVSQMAQVMALTTKMETPVDVVFVIDTSGSMRWDAEGKEVSETGKERRIETVVNLVNESIKQLMNSNPNNRIGVVAFSAYNAGGVDAGGDAANVLSNLGHYSGEEDHLTWDRRQGQGPSWDKNAPLIRGRNLNGSVGKGRAGYNGATNIQAGLAKGASLLMSADTTVQIQGKTVTRIPFLIFLSDGAPVASSSNNDWTNPSMTLTQGDHANMDIGNGFLPLLTAAYYKQKISDRYYPNGEDTLSVYTIGFAIAGSEKDMSSLTLNPAEELTNKNNRFYNDVNTAWNNYAANNKVFSVHVARPNELKAGYDHDGEYWFYNVDTTVDISKVNDIQDDTVSKTAESYYQVWDEDGTVTFKDNIVESIIPADKSISALAYNDRYFDVSDTSGLEDAFESIYSEIAQKAIASPTHVSGSNYNFDGYVTFTDVIGEYMEVKDVKGILVGDTFYQGRYVAQNLGTQGNDNTFDTLARNVIATRFLMADPRLGDAAQTKAAELIAAGTTNNTFNGKKTQAYYTSGTDYSNSLVWFGKSYESGDKFEHGVQYIAPAVDDSVEYLATATIPAGADTVCRSYLFYGTAQTEGGSQSDNNNEYMYFMVRVERNLKTYQQTVTISAPASLLSVEKVYITEDTTGREPTYTAKVEKANPAHVIYEVGLRSDINEYNVDQKVGSGSSYANETPKNGGHVNYKKDAQTGEETYYFFTNDWDRTIDSSTYMRAMSKATFYAAANNPYYTYQEDTYLYNENGTTQLKNIPSDGVAYYKRDVYSWSGTATDGEYRATKSTEMIRVNLADLSVTTNGVLRQDAKGNLYIAAGTYTAAVVSPDGSEEIHKGNNNRTDTSVVVAHPVRTGDANKAHYTVYLGNNGVIPLTAKTSKTVDITKADNTIINNANGKAVVVGEVLTYTIQAENIEDGKANVVVTDSVPKGTVFVENSAKVDGNVVAVEPDANGVLTWDLGELDPGEIKTVSFQVRVLIDALTGSGSVGAIENQAVVSINNNPAYTTNKIHNYPEGKKLVDTAGNLFAEGKKVSVGDTIVFRIRFYNDTGAPATIVVKDEVPAGTTFDATDINDAEIFSMEGNKLTWAFKDVPAGYGDVISFAVKVNASIGNITNIPNTATIIENNAEVNTNPVEIDVARGNLQLSKIVDGTNADKTFTLKLKESTGTLTGTYHLDSNVDDNDKDVTFDAGEVTIDISRNETVTIQNLPAGVTIYVEETAMPGYTPAYTPSFDMGEKTVGMVKVVEGTTAAAVSVTNTYSVEHADVVLFGTKNLNAADALIMNGEAFQFTATPYEKNAEGKLAPVANGTVLNAEAVITGESTAFAFHAIHFTSTTDGIYYLIQEVNTGATGMTYATNAYMAQIVVVDNGEGKLVPTVTYKVYDAALSFDDMEVPTAVSFKNSYKPLDVSLPLFGTKTLTGRPMRAGEFEFIVTDVTDGNNPKIVARGYNAAADSGVAAQITFGSLHYTEADVTGNQPKDFRYKITEVVPENAQKLTGITYNTENKEYDLTVTVQDVDGQLTITHINDVAVTAEQLKNYQFNFDFKNTFTPQQISLVITADKILDNKSGESVSLNEGDFRFQMVGEDQTVTARNAASGEVANGATGNALITFNPLYYTAADIGKTYTYTLSEIHPGIAALPNMHYAENQPKIQITVSQNNETHELELTVYAQDDKGAFTQQLTIKDGKTDSGADFINTLYPASISVVIPVSKATVNNDDQKTPYTGDATFSFLVLDKNENEVSANVGPANGTFNLAPLTFTEPGDYVFYVKEAHSGTVHGITHDSAYYRVDIKVERVNGKLQLAEGYPQYTQTSTTTESNVSNNTLQFKNVYDANGTLIGLTARKEFTGRELKDGEFSFKLVRQDTQEEIAGSMTADGVITFAALYFDMDDLKDAQNNPLPEKVLVYVMSEVIPDESKRLPGVTYDLENANGTLIYIKIKNDGEGHITAQLVADANGTPYMNGETEITDKKDTGITFKNKYEVKNGASLTLNLDKVLHGMTLTEKEFDFQMYRFVDVEKDGVKNGVYDEGEELYPVSTAANDKDGNVVFYREFPATTPKGTYNYFIVEARGGQTFINYDGSKYYFTMTVGDDGHGNLTVSVQGDGFTATADSTSSAAKYDTGIVFNNYYNAAGTSVVPDATKKLVNAKGVEISNMTAGDFEFEVKRIASKTDNADWVKLDGQVVSHGFNAANGDVVFSAIQYQDDPTGNHVVTALYEISEKSTGISGVEYSTDKFYMLVTVQDSANGQLAASAPVFYTSDKVTVTDTDVVIVDEPIEKPVFTNTYRPLPGSLQFVVNKTLTGRELKINEFRFEAKEIDSQGTVIPNGLYASGGNDEGEKATSAVTFSNIFFSTTGTYYFQITERSDLTVPGVSAGTGAFGDNENGFDTKTIYAKVVVENAEKGALMVKDVKYYAAFTDMIPTEGEEKPMTETPEFVNEYRAAPASVTLNALKELTGKDLAAGEFTFELDGEGFAKQTKTNAADGIVKFDPLTFTAAGNYTFTVKEQVKKLDNGEIDTRYNCDQTVYTVSVEVTDDGMGHLVATVTTSTNRRSAAADPAANYLIFRNSYQPAPISEDLSVAIGATKSVVDIYGNPLTKLDGFKFNVYDIQNNVVTTGVSDSGKIKFDEFTFSASGEYIYWITEAEDNDPSYDLDGHAWSVHILVRYNAADGVLYILPEDVQTFAHAHDGVDLQDDNGQTNTEEQIPAFVNVFNPDPVTITLNAKKLLEGREMVDSEFLFVLKNTDGLVWAEARNSADGSIAFNLTVDSADMVDGKQILNEKTFSFKIYEVVPDTAVNNVLNGVTYSEYVGSASITVKNVNGVLTVNGENPAVINTGVTFENVYKPAPATATILAQKMLVGAQMKDHTFTFELVDSENNVVATTDSKEDGTIVFELPYETAGVYTYTLREMAGKYAGMVYDDSEFTVTVTVTDDLVGNLHANVSYDITPAFENIYNGTSISETIEAKKEIVGRTLKDAEFTFELVNDADGTVIASETNDAEGKVAFDVTYTEPGEYVYILREKKGDDQLVTYDEATYKVTVVVTMDEDGYLSSKVVYETADQAVPVFRNIHTPGAVPVPLEGTKTLTGGTMTAEQFKFVVVDEDGKQVGSGTNDENGKIVFTGIAFDKVGEYELTVSEVNTGVLGMTYDTTEFKVTVEVTNNNGELTAKVTYPEGGIKFNNTYREPDLSVDVKLEGFKALTGGTMTAEKFNFKVVDENGKQVGTGTNDEKGKIIFTGITFEKVGKYELKVSEVNTGIPGMTYDTTEFKVTVEVANNNGELTAKVTYPEGGIKFVNTYRTPDAQVEVKLEGFKALTGGSMTANAFKFKVVDKDGKQVGTGTNDEKGKIIFTDIAFDKAGKYELTVSEVNTGVLGMTYDTTEFKVTVEVTNNNGELKAKVTYPEGGIKFVNTYRTPDALVEVKLEGTKTLTGGTMTAEQFKFQVVDKDGKKVGTGTNDKDGKIIFAGITFDKVGKYELTVSEVNSGVLGMTYDTTEFKVTVEVTNNNGELKAKVTYPEGGIKFVNTYRTPDALVEVKLEGTKTLTGGTMTAEQFKFQVVDKDGKQVGTGTNDKDGKINFTGIAFDKVGKYELTVSEVNSGVLGMTYDTTEFKVTVEVTNNNGELKAKVTYPEGGIKFTNTYREPDTEIKIALEATKTLTGRKLKNKEFEFQVHDSNGKLVATGTNAKDGTITFTDVVLKEAGKYELTVSEVKGKETNVIYDDAKFKVMVEVTEDNGVLSAKVTYPEKGIKFENVYKKPAADSPATGDSTPVAMLIGLMTISLAGILLMIFVPRGKNMRGKYSK